MRISRFLARYTFMPNRTIYVSPTDEKLFEDAKSIAGEALSSVISRALREFVARHSAKKDGMKEISVMVGSHDAEREQRFVGTKITTWNGFSDDKEWYLQAVIYKTQKNNWAVLLTHVAKATLFTDKKKWKANGDYLTNPKRSELIVGTSIKELSDRLPTPLIQVIEDLEAQPDSGIEYLDI
jgi:EXLDI family protein